MESVVRMNPRAKRLLSDASAILFGLFVAVAICVILLSFFGCASTKFYHNGRLVFDTQANIRGLVVSKDGTLRAELIDSSTATEAGGDLIESSIGAVVGGITAWRVLP